MEMPNEFFTLTSFGTLTGATAAVYVITSGVGRLMSEEKGLKYKKYISLGLSLIFAFIAASLVSDKTPWTWVVAVVNGFLINFTAVGLNSVTKTTPAGTGPTAMPILLRGREVGKMRAKPGTDVVMPGLERAKAGTARGKFRDPWW